MVVAATVLQLAGDFGHGRSREVGEKKEEREIEFHGGSCAGGSILLFSAAGVCLCGGGLQGGTGRGKGGTGRMGIRRETALRRGNRKGLTRGGWARRGGA
jgi:hypothetical protein